MQVRRPKSEATPLKLSLEPLEYARKQAARKRNTSMACSYQPARKTNNCKMKFAEQAPSGRITAVGIPFLPLPTTQEWGEDRGEGHPMLLLSRPSPPSDGGEGVVAAAMSPPVVSIAFIRFSSSSRSIA